MSKFGAGFQKDDKLLAWRPCRRVDSAELQKHFNRRLETDIYSGTSFADPRPKWWRNEANEVFRVPSPSRLGEWKLVWRPRGAAAPAPPPASAGGPPHSPAWGRTDALYDAGMDGPSLRGYAPYLNLDSRGSSRAGGRERTAASRGSRRAASSMGVAGEAAGDVADAERLGTGRLNFDLVQERRGTAASRRSMGTRASSRSFAPSELSDTSTRSISSSAILARIKNLEDAIKSEKTLRVKMQSMLTLSDQGIGTRTPPGGRLPALAEAYQDLLPVASAGAAGRSGLNNEGKVVRVSWCLAEALGEAGGAFLASALNRQEATRQDYASAASADKVCLTPAH